MINIILAETYGGRPICAYEAYPEMVTFMVRKGPYFKINGPYDGQNASEMQLGLAQLCHTDALGSVVGLGAGTALSFIILNCFSILGFMYSKCSGFYV